jgi:hypothetical protein
MRTSFLPATDPGLLDWGRNFRDRIEPDPERFGISEAQAAAFAAVYVAFAAAYQTVRDPSTRTTVTVAQKNAKRETLKAEARLLAKVVDGSSVTDAQRIELGLNVRKKATAKPVPDAPPRFRVNSVRGRMVSISLFDKTVPRRGRPPAVHGAMVFSYIGDVPPEDPSLWRFTVATTKTELDVEFPLSVQPGAKVWLTACWLNPMLQAGPLCEPVSTHAGFAGLKMAA